MKLVGQLRDADPVVVVFDEKVKFVLLQ